VLPANPTSFSFPFQVDGAGNYMYTDEKNRKKKQKNNKSYEIEELETGEIGDR